MHSANTQDVHTIDIIPASAHMLALLTALASGTRATSATAISTTSSRRSHARAAAARSGCPCMGELSFRLPSHARCFQACEGSFP